MPSSADPPAAAESPRAVVVRTLIALERSCLDADAAFLERRWNDVTAAFAAQTRMTDELRRLFDAAPETAPAHDPKIARRIRGIIAYRDDQLRRLEAYHADTATRLQATQKLRGFARAIGKPNAQLIDASF